MTILFKPVYFTKQKVDECYGLCVEVRHPDGQSSTNSIAFPTTVTGKEAAKKLRELASWIEKESK
ncbi:MAG TPA: hypothetical protein VF443_01800 [Nitrospira sp.]